MKKSILQIGLIILLISPAHDAQSSSKDTKESHVGIHLGSLINEIVLTESPVFVEAITEGL